MVEEPTKSPQKKYREITDEELKEILAKHKLWLESNGKDGEQADLSYAYLRGADLKNVNLQKANLRSANLQGADLSEANLQDAVLYLANLQNAGLKQTNLKGAILERANLSNSVIFGARFQGAVLGFVSLDNVKCYGDELGGADITGAKLPDSIKEYKTLGVLEETSKNARKIFLAMLLGCAYSWLTILSTNDVALLTNSASSPLPIIRTAIPIAWFYIFAPIILIGSFLYMHFYLRELWEGFAVLPAKFEDGREVDKRTYPWLLNCLVRRHFSILKGECPQFEKKEDASKPLYIIKWFFHRLWHLIIGTRPFLTRLKEWSSVFLAWWVVPLTLMAFWLRYIPRRDWFGTKLHIILIVLSIGFGILFYGSMANVLRRKEKNQFRLRRFYGDKRFWHIIVICLVIIVISGLSLFTINGFPDNAKYKRALELPDNDLSENSLYYKVPEWFKYAGYDVFADFQEKDVSAKPDNYWLVDISRSDSSIVGANLKGANLRFANNIKAFLQKANLRGAKLQGAKLWYTNLQEANLEDANLQKGQLIYANLQKSNLENANFQGAILYKTNLQGANLSIADNLVYEKLTSVFWDSTTIWPNYIDPDSLKKIQDSMYWYHE